MPDTPLNTEQVDVWYVVHDVTVAFMLFLIIYITQAALKLAKSKLSRQCCLEILKQKAALKFLRFRTADYVNLIK